MKTCKLIVVVVLLAFAIGRADSTVQPEGEIRVSNTSERDIIVQIPTSNGSTNVFPLLVMGHYKAKVHVQVHGMTVETEKIQ